MKQTSSLTLSPDGRNALRDRLQERGARSSTATRTAERWSRRPAKPAASPATEGHRLRHGRRARRRRAVAASPDGESVYVTAGSVRWPAILDRNPGTGRWPRNGEARAASPVRKKPATPGGSSTSEQAESTSAPTARASTSAPAWTAVTVFDRSLVHPPPDTTPPSGLGLQVRAGAPQAAVEDGPASASRSRSRPRYGSRSNAPPRAEGSAHCQAPTRKQAVPALCPGRRPALSRRPEALPTRRHNQLRFTRRVGKRALKPGAYRATIVATDEAGNRSSAPPRAVHGPAAAACRR